MKVFFTGVLALAFALSVSAQEKADPIKDSFNQMRNTVQQEKQGVKDQVKEQVKEVRATAQEKAATLKAEFEAKRETAKKELEAKKVELKNTVNERREAVKTQVEAKRVELKEKTAKIKDEKKQQVIERVYTQVNELNKRSTDHYVNTLDKIAELLDRVKSRADKAEANGLDVSVARTAVANADVAINAARTAVQTQAGKTYSFSVNTEATLKSDVGIAREALHTDLKAVEAQVKTAKEAVREVVTALAKIKGVNEAEVK